jgi:hypothetical protein
VRRRNRADPAGIERIMDELAIYRRAGFRPLPRARWVLAPS